MKLTDRIKRIFRCEPPVAGGGSAATIGSEPTPPEPPEKPDAPEPEVKDEKPACVKCGSYEWVATSPPMATQKRYVKDENGERIELTCWCCGYKWTEPTWDAEAQNMKSKLIEQLAADLNDEELLLILEIAKTELDDNSDRVKELLDVTDEHFDPIADKFQKFMDANS